MIEGGADRVGTCVGRPALTRGLGSEALGCLGRPTPAAHLGCKALSPSGAAGDLKAALNEVFDVRVDIIEAGTDSPETCPGRPTLPAFPGSKARGPGLVAGDLKVLEVGGTGYA